MRRLSRLDMSIDRLRPRTTLTSIFPLVCSTCGRPSPFSTSAPRCDGKLKLDFTEKMRRKIWGTDNPPGAPNPYGRGGFVDDRVTKHNKKFAKENTKDRAKEVEIVVKKVPAPPSKEEFSEEEQVDGHYYEPATTWEGLQRVGTFPKKEFSFEGFISNSKNVRDIEAAIALHRATVETLVLSEAGLPLATIGAGGVRDDMTTGVQISFAGGQPSLQFPEGGITKEDIIQSLGAPRSGTSPENKAFDETAVKSDPTESEEDVAADRSIADPLDPEAAGEDRIDEIAVDIEPTESEEDVAADRSVADPLHPGETAMNDNLTQSEEDIDADRSSVDPLKHGSGLDRATADAIQSSWDPTWKTMSLESPDIKFAIIKRTMQLTGIRITDPNIQNINNIQSLKEILTTKPKPRKLAETLDKKFDLTGLPNVKIIGQRVTAIDREKAVGRWKIIEEELKKKGLPLSPRFSLGIGGQVTSRGSM